MRPPDLPTAAPSYAELFAEGCFAQRSLVSVRTLRKATLDRGVELPPSPRRDCLEPLDSSGGFSPIGFLLTNFTPETVWFNPDPELMVWREERRFQPWDDYGWYLQEGGHIEVSERYSPWQLLYLVDALDEWGGHRALRRIEPQFENPPDVILARRAAAEARLRTLDEEWRSVVKLLVALQPRLWPYRRGRTTLLYEPEGGDAVSPLPRAIETFDSRALLRRFELSLGGLARLHLDLADAGRRLDPMPRWFRLAEAAPRSVTDELRGDALRARDFYDAAYLLRGLYYLATDRWLPRADEVDDGRTVYEYRRRHLPRRDQPEPFQRIDLKEILVREGLYPHRIHFFVEGHSEKVVLERVLTFLDYELPGSGITVTNIRGVDQAQRQALIFQSASQVAARTVLIADLEGTLSKTLHRLQVEGLFTDNENVLLWSKDGRSVDFEEANFSEREILNAIRTAARRRNHELRFDLTVRELRQERARRTRPRRPPPALTKLALKLAEDQGIRVSKSKELAPVLAEKLISDIRRAGHIAEAGKRRPLLARLWHWLQSER